jgi:quercetin dioxygenase-like cupin family protein
MSRIVLTVCAVLIGSLFALAQDKERIVAPADEKFGPFPNFPSCMTGAVLHGDPSSSSGVTLIGKGTAGCKIPWHFHTPNEEVGIISGTAKVQMKNEAAKTLTAGGYAYLPSKHPHEFTCVTACKLFAGADGVFDIHYVDASGNEIPSDQALKSKKHGTQAKPMPKQ